MKRDYFILVTPLDKLSSDFIPAYEQFLEYGKITGLFVAIAGVMAAVIKSSRN